MNEDFSLDMQHERYMRCSKKLWKIKEKTPATESFFKKKADKRFHHKRFPATYGKLIRTNLLENTS